MPQHSLLQRQLKRFFTGTAPLPDHWQAFIEAVNQAYFEADADRKMLERALDLSSQELLQANSEMQAAVQAFPDIFFLLDQHGTIVSCKGGTSADFHLSPEQLIGRRIADAPWGDAGAKFRHALDDAQARQAIVSVEYAFPHQGQEEFYEARLAPLRNRQTLMIVRNVRERKRAEILLRNAHDVLEHRIAERTAELITANRALRSQIAERKRAEEQRDHFFAASADMLCVAGFDGYFKQLNPAWEKMLGWTVEELRARPCLDFVHPDDQASTAAEAKALTEAIPTVAFENRYRCKNGSYRWLQWSAAPLMEQRLIYATARDVTERRRLEIELRQSQKLEAVGRLAGGIAHDFNNLLMVIAGCSETILDALPAHDPNRTHIRQIQEAGERAASLTQQLLVFSRQQVLQAAVLDLNEIVNNTERMLRRVIGGNIRFTTSIAPEPALMKGDPGQIEQVIMNLAINARDAMPHGGSLTIATSIVEIHQPIFFSHDTVSAGNYVVLDVSDTGQGMDAATQAKIFDPFFTTKTHGKGTGLGLAIVYGIVKQSNGHIVVHSEAGHGSSFKIYLPKAARETIETAAAPAASQPLSGTETILVVEDEVIVRAMIVTSLQKRGYRVYAAKNGMDALQILESQSDRTHFVVTDIVMPGMNGRDLGNHILLRHPSIKILYMSGFANEAFACENAQESGGAFLQKPFTQEALARKVREILDR